MIALFPRLPRATATLLAAQQCRAPVEVLREGASIEHPAVAFATTGGTRVSNDRLRRLCKAVRELASDCGYPGARAAPGSDAFDARLGRLLHETSGLALTEGCRDEVWNFVGCLLLPDIVRWRFPGEKTTEANFLGRDRGITNALGRTWWAAEVLYDEEAADPYELLAELGVDETVGFSRRSSSVVSRRVAVAIARSVIWAHRQGVPFARTDLMRDVMKRFLRLTSVVSFEALSSDELTDFMRRLALESASLVAGSRELSFEPPASPPHASADSPSGATSELFEILSRVQLSSRSASRFNELKEWLVHAAEGADGETVVKYLADAKNYRNRIGEALRRQPALAFLVHSGGPFDAVIDAVESRLGLSPETTVAVCTRAQPGDPWKVPALVVSGSRPPLRALRRLFDQAEVHAVQLAEPESNQLSADVASRLNTALARADFDDEALDLTVVQLLEEVAGIPGNSVRIKHVSEAKNLGNRISEALGTGAAALVLSTTEALTVSACKEMSRQLDALSQSVVGVVLPQDGDGEWSTAPVLVRQHESPSLPTAPNESNDDSEPVDWSRSSPASQPSPELRSRGPEDSDDSPRPSEPSADNTPDLFELELDEQIAAVWRHLLWQGPLAKDEAVRLAAAELRDEGLVDYGRLAARGRVYLGVLAAIEAGVRQSYFDRPARGEVRAVLESPDVFSREDWQRCTEQALPPGESVTREQAVRLTAEWARDVLGLEYARIRRSGRIDTGVRNAMRTLLRRGVLERDGRECVVMVKSS